MNNGLVGMWQRLRSGTKSLALMGNASAQQGWGEDAHPSRENALHGSVVQKAGPLGYVRYRVEFPARWEPADYHPTRRSPCGFYFCESERRLTALRLRASSRSRDWRVGVFKHPWAAVSAGRF